VNYNGQVLYDEYVKPEGRITNFRTWVSGVAPHHMSKAKPFMQAKAEVHKILLNKTIVGHSLTGDFRVLHYEEIVTKEKVRDTSKYKKFQSNLNQAQSLKNLTELFLNRRIQSGQHCSVTDARAALALYRISEQEWENYIKQKNYTNVKKIVHHDVNKMASFFGAKNAENANQKKSFFKFN
jgi:RNA exonuclease 4